MAEAEPIDAVPLGEGERVLWQGRPGFGAPWQELWPVLRLASFAWLVVVALLATLALGLLDGERSFGPWLALRVVAWIAGVVGLLIAPFALSFVLAKVVGPYHLSFLSLGVCGPIYAVRWSSTALSRGWQAALDRQTEGDFLAAALLVGLPLARIGVGVLRRVNVVYLLTDRRAVAVRGGAAPRLLWSVPLVRDHWLQARVTWPIGGPPKGARRRGHLAVGHGRERRDLTMIEDPDQALAIVREALGDRIVPLKRRVAGAPPRPAST